MKNWLNFPDKATMMRAKFLQRYHNKVLIFYKNLPNDFLKELLKLPGGGGYFRINVDNITPNTPLLYLYNNYLEKLSLPHPFLLSVEEKGLYIRHLIRDGRVVYPIEIAWFLSEIHHHFHICLRFDKSGFIIDNGMDIKENPDEQLAYLGL